MTEDEKTAKIRELNDDLRINGHVRNGRVVAVGSIVQADAELRNKACAVMRQFKNFTPGDDPYGQHDFGAFTVDGERFMFKIDYYSLDEQHASEHPEDQNVTMRVLSLFFAEDY